MMSSFCNFMGARKAERCVVIMQPIKLNKQTTCTSSRNVRNGSPRGRRPTLVYLQCLISPLGEITNDDL